MKKEEERKTYIIGLVGVVLLVLEATVLVLGVLGTVIEGAVQVSAATTASAEVATPILVILHSTACALVSIVLLSVLGTVVARSSITGTAVVPLWLGLLFHGWWGHRGVGHFELTERINTVLPR